MQERYVIHVTKQCNMACTYCYEKDKTSTYAKDEVVQVALNIAKNCKDESFGIEFLGGEPMLAFDYIQAVYEALENQYPNKVSSYVITTNGTILNDDVIKFLKENPKMYFAISMDGTRWANQLRGMKNGVNSFDVVVANIKYFIKKLDTKQLGVHIVTHPYNVGSTFNSIKFLYNLGVRNIGVGTVESTINIDAQYCDRFVAEMQKVSNAIHNGKFKDLTIDLFDNPKPEDDQRYYIYDPKTGKTIGESYGRTKNDITNTKIYDSVQVSSPIGDIIVALRHCVYANHIATIHGNAKEGE